MFENLLVNEKNGNGNNTSSGKVDGVVNVTGISAAVTRTLYTSVDNIAANTTNSHRVPAFGDNVIYSLDNDSVETFQTSLELPHIGHKDLTGDTVLSNGKYLNIGIYVTYSGIGKDLWVSTGITSEHERNGENMFYVDLDRAIVKKLPVCGIIRGNVAYRENKLYVLGGFLSDLTPNLNTVVVYDVSDPNNSVIEGVYTSNTPLPDAIHGSTLVWIDELNSFGFIGGLKTNSVDNIGATYQENIRFSLDTMSFSTHVVGPSQPYHGHWNDDAWYFNSLNNNAYRVHDGNVLTTNNLVTNNCTMVGVQGYTSPGSYSNQCSYLDFAVYLHPDTTSSRLYLIRLE